MGDKVLILLESILTIVAVLSVFIIFNMLMLKIFDLYMDFAGQILLRAIEIIKEELFTKS